MREFLFIDSYPEDHDGEEVFVALPPRHAGADGGCPDYGSRYDPCPPGCASGTCVYAGPIRPLQPDVE